MYHTLLFTTDLLEGAERLCEQAVLFAKQFNAKLYILHVVEPPITAQYAQALGFAEMIEPPTEAAKAVLDTLADANNIKADYRIIKVGSASHQIIETAKMLFCDAIIIGSHASHNPLPEFLGRTAEKVMHSAPCDVITLKNQSMTSGDK